MTKIVINSCFGGFGLSNLAKEKLGIEYEYGIKRDDPNLVQIVEELGEKANEDCASLKVIEIPDEATDWMINEYDGNENIIYVLDGLLQFAY